MNNLIYLPDVTTLALDPEKCIGCAICTQVCPHNVFAMVDRRAEIINRDACMECGACQMNCSASAIHVDVGVGCATAVINTALGFKSGGCCCTIESTDSEPCETAGPRKTGCC